MVSPAEMPLAWSSAARSVALEATAPPSVYWRPLSRRFVVGSEASALRFPAKVICLVARAGSATSNGTRMSLEDGVWNPSATPSLPIRWTRWPVEGSTRW